MVADSAIRDDDDGASAELVPVEKPEAGDGKPGDGKPPVVIVEPEMDEERLLEIWASFSGPLPPPEMLEAYKRAFPECPQRIVKMAEDQLQHRHRLEERKLTGDIAAERRGSYLGVALTGGAIAGAVYLLGAGQSLAGYVIFATQVVVVVALKLLARHDQAKELEEKTEPKEGQPEAARDRARDRQAPKKKQKKARSQRP